MFSLLSYRRVKAYAKMKVIMGSGSSQFTMCHSEEGKIQMRVFISFLVILLGHRELGTKNGKPTLPIIPFGIVVYAFTFSRTTFVKTAVYLVTNYHLN